MNSRIGVVAPLVEGGVTLKKVKEFGLRRAEVVCWAQAMLTTQNAEALRREIETADIRVSSFWAGWPGPKVWNFVDGPSTLGIVPALYRRERMDALKKAGDFAQNAGISAVVTHLGFIPENPANELFTEVVSCVREVADYLGERNVEFWFESGQETPVTMLRLLRQTGNDNLGLNLDPANLILYGKASPVDSLDVFGKYVRSVHAKDGLYPTEPMSLGAEVRIGDGSVHFPKLIKKLNGGGYMGPYIIEREITGPQQEKDIRYAVDYLGDLLDGLSV